MNRTSAGGAQPASRRFVSIRAKVLAAAAILLVGSTLVYGTVAFTTARTALLPSIREQLADDAVNVKSGLEEMLTAHYRNVHSWARLALMRQLLVRDIDKTVARFLESVQRDYGTYVAVLALDRDGVCLASSQPRDIGRSFAGTPLAGSAATEPGPTLEWSGLHDAWYVRLAAPVPDPDRPGNVLGTLVAMLDRRVLDRIVVSKPGHSQVALRLLDKHDRLVAGRQAPMKIVHVETWHVEGGASPGHFPAGSPALVQEGRDKDGRSFIIAEVPVGNRETLPTPGWRLTASVPRELALAPVAAVRDRVFTTGIGLVLFALAAAAVLADRLARPIDNLTRVARRIASSGDLEPVPAPTSNDEVGELTRAFQRMVSAVAAANNEMVRTSKLAFLGEMAAGMAHEIRTPIGIIRNAAQLLERRMVVAGDGEAGEWAVIIRDESDRLTRVVTELLDFVKPVPPVKNQVNLDALVTRAANLLSAEAAGRGVRLEVAGSKTPVTAPCDADQIHQVCLNLLMNALQASPRGAVVEIAVAASGDEARLIVRDRGSGLPADIVAHLFEPFTSQRDGGIGLGLAIVRRIVRAHGGDVVAGNRAGGGAEFIVSLPIHRPGTVRESHET